MVPVLSMEGLKGLWDEAPGRGRKTHVWTGEDPGDCECATNKETMTQGEICCSARVSQTTVNTICKANHLRGYQFDFLSWDRPAGAFPSKSVLDLERWPRLAMRT